MQGAQTASRTRGIGRYSTAFAEALVRNRGPHDVVLALNGLFPDTVMPIREAFADLLPRNRILVWEAPGPLAASEGNAERRARAALIRQAFLASLDPDIVHVTSLFEGFVDDAVVSVGARGGTCATSVTLYDLIPLHDPDRFLKPNPAGEAHYRQSLAQLERADLLLAISDFTARDATQHLALPSERIVNVSSAHDAAFGPRNMDRAERDDLRRRFRIRRNFILTSGTVEPHKNLDRLFAAFAQLPPRLRTSHSIVLVGRFVGWQGDILAEMAARAGLRKGELVLTGYVSDADLVGLYNDCALMVFPSLDEGFGLPALEAMACGAPTIGSRAASIPEIIGRDDAQFDPTDVGDIARLMARALDDAPFRASLAEHALFRAAKFSWDATARVALGAMERATTDRHAADGGKSRMDAAEEHERPRLALFVDEGEGEGRSDATVATVLRALSHQYRVTLVGARRAEVVGAASSCEEPAWLAANAHEVDRLLYWPKASGPSPDAIDLMRRAPGILWLTDAIKGTSRPHSSEMDGPHPWIEALYEGRGYLAVRDALASPEDARALDSDVLGVLQAARGVMFGSEAVAEAARDWTGNRVPRRWEPVPQPINGEAEAELADLFFEAIEALYRDGDALAGLADALAGLDPPLNPPDLPRLSDALARNFPATGAQRQLLVDVTHTSQNTLRTGIQRVVRATVLALLEAPPAGFRVEPVYLSADGRRWHYRYARGFTLGLMGCRADLLADDVVETAPNDVLHVLDLSGQHFIDAEAEGLHADLQRRGIATYATVYDLLPVQIPELFPYGTRPGFEQWLRAIGRLDGAFCISAAVASDYRLWRRATGLPERHHIGWFHLGADIDNSDPTRGMPPDAEAKLAAFATRPTFLMVGTIEPRKGHLQAIAAFERLWRAGIDVNLVIVGAEGWRGLPERMRRTIPEILARLDDHAERDRRLFWLNGISDEYLEKVYAASTCLIAASEGEGFGLPLIEAARHRIPILARDLPVFREVAGDHAAYFSGLAPADLAAAVEGWLALQRAGGHPRSEGMPWSTWQESARRIADLIATWDRFPPASGD